MVPTSSLRQSRCLLFPCLMSSSAGDSDDDEDYRRAVNLSLQSVDEDEDMETAVILSLTQEPSEETMDLEEALRVSRCQAESLREHQELQQALDRSFEEASAVTGGRDGSLLPPPFVRTPEGDEAVDAVTLRLMVHDIMSNDKEIERMVGDRMDDMIRSFMQELEQSEDDDDDCQRMQEDEDGGVQTTTSSSGSRVPASSSSSTRDSMLELEEITSVEPTAGQHQGRQVRLPPSGDIRKPVFEVGDQVFAAPSDNDVRFFRALVTRCPSSDPGTTVAKIGVEFQEESDRRLPAPSAGHRDEVPVSRIAVRTKPHLMLKVGMHVMTESNRRSGMVAELAKVTNAGRYLVFYENGESAYVSPEDLRLVGDLRFRCEDYGLPLEFCDFLKQYLVSYPERRMVRPSVGTHIEIRNFLTGGWEKAVVKELDCSLMTIRFPSSNHKETIYRGCHRIKEIFDSFVQEKKRLLVSRSPRAMRSTGVHLMRSSLTHRLRPTSDHHLPIHYSVDDETDARTLITGSTASQETRDNQDVQRRRRPQQQRRQQEVSFLKTGLPVVKPRLFEDHDCGTACVVRETDVMRLFRGYNPFAIPMLCGWSRRVFETSLASNGRSIVYVAPCGRSIRTIDELQVYLSLTESPLDIMYFSMETEVEIFRSITASVMHQCYWFLEDLSQGQETQPISVLNFVDEDRLDPKFRYRSQRFPGPGVHLTLDAEFLSCCDCIDNCSDPQSCSCQRLTSEGFDVIPGLAEVSRVRGYRNKRLEASIPFGIYECNSRCSCNSRCPTRVVQNGIQVLLQVFKTSKKGWGVRTLHDIPKGTFITVYSAQILNEESADDFGHRIGDEYFANLDFIDCAEATKEAYESEAAFSMDDDSDDDSSRDPDDDDDDDDENVDDDPREEDAGFRDASDDEDYVAPPMAAVPPRDPHPQSSTDTQRTERRTRPQVAVKRTSSSTPSVAETVRKEGDVVPSTDAEGGETKTERRAFRSFFEGSSVYILDAMSEGNVGRFLNHSCSPTAFAQNVFYESHDLRFPTVAFFASRNIFALEEITWDYQYEVDSVPGRKLYCYCHSADCRGRLI